MSAKEDNGGRSTTLALEPDSSSDESEDEDNQQVTVQMPPTHFSNVQVQNSSNVHFGNSAVYVGDVTVIMSPADLNNVDNSLSLQHLKQTGEKTVLVSNGQRANLNDDAKSKLAAVELILGKAPDPAHSISSAADKSGIIQAQKLCYKLSRRRIIAIVSIMTVIIALLISLLVIWNAKGSIHKKCEDSSDEIECPVYDKASNYINGTEGSAPYYSRIDWLALPANHSELLKLPVEFIIISHSATNPCYNNSQCIVQVRKFQMYHTEGYGWADIGYNFLVGGDGGIYEGRGWDKIGAHAKGYNTRGIGVNMIGTFIDVLPPNDQMKALKILIEEGVRLGKLRKDYKLIGHRQVSPTESPGITFFRELQTWPHWYNFVDLPKGSKV